METYLRLFQGVPRSIRVHSRAEEGSISFESESKTLNQVLDLEAKEVLFSREPVHDQIEKQARPLEPQTMLVIQVDDNVVTSSSVN